MKIIKDKDNLCLKCKYAIGIYYNQKIQRRGYEYTRCDCELMDSKNVGHRKTCKHFKPNEIEEERK